MTLNLYLMIWPVRLPLVWNLLLTIISICNLRRFIVQQAIWRRSVLKNVQPSLMLNRCLASCVCTALGNTVGAMANTIAISKNEGENLIIRIKQTSINDPVGDFVFLLFYKAGEFLSLSCFLFSPKSDTILSGY